MKYKVHTVGKDIDREAAEILCGENLEYVGKGNGHVFKSPEKGLATKEIDLDEI